MTPVDFFVRSIAQIANDESNFGQVYNVTEPKGMPAKVVFELLKERDYISSYVSVEKWKAKLVEKAQKDGDAVLSVVSQFFGTCSIIHICIILLFLRKLFQSTKWKIQL